MRVEPVVVLIGAHCTGKTTLGTQLALALGHRFDGEVGERVHLAARARGLVKADDWSILAEEMARDAVGSRVVESWHFGNIAWARHRPGGLCGAELEALERRACDALRAVCEVRPVVVLCLECDEVTRRHRRAESGAKRMPPFEGLAEEEFFQLTSHVGRVAVATATAQGCNVHLLSSDAQAVAATVREAAERVLRGVLPQPAIPDLPMWFESASVALAVLCHAASVVPELADQLDLCGHIITRAMAEAPAECELPVIAVDGLDGCGKSTLVASLAIALGGLVARTPPASLDGVRRVLECAEVTARLKGEALSRVKRALYMVGNYVCVMEMCEMARDSAARASACIVLDRYYGSTAAYTLGSHLSKVCGAMGRELAVGEGGSGGGEAEEAAMDALPESVWRWPSDLMRPSVWLLLEASEETRRARIVRRAGPDGRGVGEWERLAAQDASLGRWVQAAYKRVETPSRVVIDAEPTPAKVLEQAVAACGRAGIGCDARQCDPRPASAEKVWSRVHPDPSARGTRDAC